MNRQESAAEGGAAANEYIKISDPSLHSFGHLGLTMELFKEGYKKIASNYLEKNIFFTPAVAIYIRGRNPNRSAEELLSNNSRYLEVLASAKEKATFKLMQDPSGRETVENLTSTRVLKILSKPILDGYIIPAIKSGMLDPNQKMKIARRIDHGRQGKDVLVSVFTPITLAQPLEIELENYSPADHAANPGATQQEKTMDDFRDFLIEKFKWIDINPPSSNADNPGASSQTQIMHLWGLQLLAGAGPHPIKHHYYYSLMQSLSSEELQSLRDSVQRCKSTASTREVAEGIDYASLLQNLSLEEANPEGLQSLIDVIQGYEGTTAAEKLNYTLNLALSERSEPATNIEGATANESTSGISR